MVWKMISTLWQWERLWEYEWEESLPQRDTIIKHKQFEPLTADMAGRPLKTNNEQPCIIMARGIMDHGMQGV